jgi:dihydrofolate reductase
MRTVTYGAACSLDGFITGPDGGLDWLHFSNDVHALIAAYWKTIDTILMGRVTWAAAPRSSNGGSKKSVPKIRTYVFSRTLQQIDEPGVELVREDAAGFVRRLKEQPGKGICVMGGGRLGSALLEAGVVDEVGVNVHPVLLGGGVPLFQPMSRRIALHLVDSKPLDGGCVSNTYRVVHA